MYAKLIDENSSQTIRYTTTEGDSMYYVQIINPTHGESVDADSFKEEDSFMTLSGGVLCP